MGSILNSLLYSRRNTFVILLAFFSISLAFTQQKTITGKVISQVKDSISGIDNIYIGYGTQKKNEVTSSIANVRFDEFNKGNINNPVQLIQGKVAGLGISKPGGDPNGMYNIRLRGLSTIHCNTAPLIVVDGMVEGNLNNVDPNDIESITVLRDGAAAAIYGTRGSSGVILVMTKRGKKGTSIIEYNSYATAEVVARNAPMMNASEWRSLRKEVSDASGSPITNDFGASTDWFKEIEQTALSQVHNLSMSGGNDLTTYRASVNYRKGEGVAINTGYTQLNGRINFIQKALNDKFTLDLNLGATERKSDYGFDAAFRYASISNPTAPVKSNDPAYANYDGYFQMVNTFDYYNPVSILELNKNERKDRILNLSLKGEYDIIKGLQVNALYSVQSNSALGGQYFGKSEYWNQYWRNGLASRQLDNAVSQIFELTGHYSGNITSSLNLSALGGYSYQDFTNEGFYAQGGDFLIDAFSYNNLGAALDFKNGIGTVTSYKNSNKLIAFFGRVSLNIQDTWFVNASTRYEGSSRFGVNNKWGLFPAVGGGVDLVKLLNISSISNFKLRANYGVTGNQPSESYLSLPRLGSNSVHYYYGYYGNNYYYNGEFIPGYSLVNNANPDLKWEKKGEFDMGFDFSLIRSRLSGSFDYYTRTSKDILYRYNVPAPPELYYQSWLNLGEIKSSGLELTLHYNAIKKSDFSYNISFYYSHNSENTLVSLSGTYKGAEITFWDRDIGSLGSPGWCCMPLIRLEEGQPIGQLYGYIFKEIDENGYQQFVDADKSGYVDYQDRQIVGSGLPKSMIGFGNAVTYKNWDLYIFFRGVFGHYLLNSFRAMYEAPIMTTSYNVLKTSGDMRNGTTGTLMNSSGGAVTDEVVENASFISLDNVSSGYSFSLPGGSPFSKIRLYLASNNLFFITKYQGSDPNPRYIDSDPNCGTCNSPLVPGIDRRDSWFRTRSVTLGANIIL